MEDDNNASKGLNIKGLISPFFRHKLLIFSIIIVGTVITYVTILLETPIYEASVKMHIKGVQTIQTDFYRGIGARRIHYTHMAIISSNPVMSRTVKVLKLHKRPFDYEKKFSHPLKHFIIDYYTKKLKKELKKFKPKQRKKLIFRRAVKDLKEKVFTSLIPRTDIFEIIVSDFSPEGAIAIANVISRSYSIFDQQQQLADIMQKYGQMHPVVLQLKYNIRLMTRKLSGKKLSDIKAIGTASVKIIEQATSNYVPIGKPKWQMFLIGVLVSILVGLGLAFVLDFFSKTIISIDDIEKKLAMPVIGSLPKRKFREKESIINVKNETPYIRFYRELSEQLLVLMRTQNMKSVMIISAEDYGTNSHIVANLGFCLSHYLDHKTLIIDANFRSPSIHKIFEIDEGPGLADVLEDKKVELIDNIDSKLSILQAGNTNKNPISLLDKFNQKMFFEESREKFEIVIVNCSDISKFKDSFILSSHVDGVVLVIHEGKDYKEVVKSLILPFYNNQSKLVGAVLNGRTFVIPKFLYKRI